MYDNQHKSLSGPQVSLQPSTVQKDQGPIHSPTMSPTTTVAPIAIEHELNGDAILEDRVVGDHCSNASADANFNTSNTHDDDDYITQSDVDDGSGGSSDGTGPETEALEKEMERYVPRTKPSPPAVGAKGSSKPYTQGKGTSTKSGRPLAVTATVKTTAPRPK
ncbi:hypothetical protein EDB92DRAFT_1617365 [Lactarius akahatsu]|uniref:Uncharacterized protein n=1 Tax=Lactarius akahatsu TaxID=416441 RepID=A0AAD4Q6S5_9AGAM|nr:hypothetical protein EDB92DRAFT_1617365 [Lactarius akahatsu]